MRLATSAVCLAALWCGTASAQRVFAPQPLPLPPPPVIMPPVVLPNQPPVPGPYLPAQPVVPVVPVTPTGPGANRPDEAAAVAPAIGWAHPLLFVSGGMFLGALSTLAAVWVWGNAVVGVVRVVAPPAGEAPDEVRAAWVGVELPLRRGRADAVALPTAGVLSNELQGDWVGYRVRASDALARLRVHAPWAADWWAANCPMIKGAELVFPASVCEKLG